MAQEAAPRRRFAPVPIETTFQKVRRGGPAAELTPSPSPRSASPPSLARSRTPERRRFAPQLIDSSRRSRKSGDVGPATKPTDKTDITPYTNHIYAPKAKRRHQKVLSLSRRESCDDETANQVFHLVARDAERKDEERRLQEVAMSAFPNAGVRAGGAEHFFVRESSEDDSSGSRGRSKVRPPGPWQSRRDSTEEDVGWAVREMQEHHDLLVKLRGPGDRVSTLDLDNMSLEGPPGDALWTTTKRKSSDDSIRPIGESLMPLIANDPLPTIREGIKASYEIDDSPPLRPIGETVMPYIPSAPPGAASSMPYIAASSRIPPESGFRSRGAFGAPYGGYQTPNLAADRELRKLRGGGSPPMLGQDIKFRMCHSPEMTKLEPDHLWLDDLSPERANRDKTGQNGLWNGYCYSPHLRDAIAPIDRPAMIATPLPESALGGDPFAVAFGSISGSISEEPSAISVATSEHRPRSGESKGLHMLTGLDERLRKEKEEQAEMEKAAAEREMIITTEFTDYFVTQVYNYLSLGYPAMARQYDDELSKISGIGTDKLQRAGNGIMEDIGGKKGGAPGHIALEMAADGTVDDDGRRCPRWEALKLYVLEWARQHPDLHNISPLAWGVRERRGSWAI